MKRQMRFMLLGCLLALSANTVQAHSFAETADCKPPKKPLEFFSETEKQQFETKVGAYRDCLESFVTKQNQAMQIHKTSADKAAETWKHYVETVLKATVTPADGQSPQQ